MILPINNQVDSHAKLLTALAREVKRVSIDTQRLDLLFSVFGIIGIYARRNLAFCRQHGWEYVQKNLRAGTRVCFTTKEDDVVISTDGNLIGPLHLSWGVVGGSVQTEYDLAPTIIVFATVARFHVVWRGTTNDRIALYPGPDRSAIFPYLRVPN